MKGDWKQLGTIPHAVVVSTLEIFKKNCFPVL